MSSPAPLDRHVSRNTHDIEALYELLEGVDGRIAKLKEGQDALKTDQQALTKKVDAGFDTLNQKLDLLLSKIGGDGGSTPTA
jgi:hypothetical protein